MRSMPSISLMYSSTTSATRASRSPSRGGLDGTAGTDRWRMRARSLVILREEVVDVRAFERQELAAVDASAVILGRRESGAELVAWHRFGELGGIHRIVHRSLRNFSGALRPGPACPA